MPRSRVRPSVCHKLRIEVNDLFADRVVAASVVVGERDSD